MSSPNSIISEARFSSGLSPMAISSDRELPSTDAAMRLFMVLASVMVSISGCVYAFFFIVTIILFNYLFPLDDVYAPDRFLHALTIEIIEVTLYIVYHTSYIFNTCRLAEVDGQHGGIAGNCQVGTVGVHLLRSRGIDLEEGHLAVMILQHVGTCVLL